MTIQRRYNVPPILFSDKKVYDATTGAYVNTNDPYFNPAGSRELQRVR